MTDATGNCLCCKARDTGGHNRHACHHCTNHTRRQLRETELYTTWLHHTALLEPTRGTTGRRQPGYHSTPAARLEVLVMLDHRSGNQPLGEDDDDTPLWSILGTLAGLAQTVAQHADQTRNLRQATVSSEIGYLLGRLDWAAHQPWIVDLAADIASLHAQARQLAHDVPPEALGECLNDPRGQHCEGTVYWLLRATKDGGNQARCSVCRRIYTGVDLVRLGASEERKAAAG